MAADWLLQVYSTMVEAEEMGENVWKGVIQEILS
jgi:hypothetical protein